MSSNLFGPAPALSNHSFALLHSDNPGEGFLSPEDWVTVAEQFQLTPRELSVAVLMFEGKSRFQISRRLGCAPGTVRVHIDRLFAKLHVNDRLKMALRIVRACVDRTLQAISASHKSAT